MHLRVVVVPGLRTYVGTTESTGILGLHQFSYIYIFDNSFSNAFSFWPLMRVLPKFILTSMLSFHSVKMLNFRL